MSNEPAYGQSAGDVPAWIVIIILLLGVMIAEWRSPLGIAASGLTSLAVACCALAIGTIFYRQVRRREHFAVMCIAMIHMLLFSAAGAVLSYLLAREGGALWDARFEAWDKALGFDWLAYARLVDSHAWIALPFRLAYASLIPQIIVIVLALGFAQRLRELRSVILAAMLCGTVTILLSPLFPAVSNFVHLGLGPADFRNVNPWAGYTHLADYEALRNSTLATMDLPKMQGIITFPSYHAGLATVTLWGFLQSEVRILRWSGAAVALTTIAATPVDGGHYLVDVIAGVAIALASIFAAKRFVSAAMQAPLKSSPFRRLRAVPAQ